MSPHFQGASPSSTWLVPFAEECRNRVPDLQAAKPLAQAKDVGLFDPAHRKVLADDLRYRKVRGLAPFQDHRLKPRCEKSQWDAGTDVRLRMPRLAGNVGEGLARTKGSRPEMRFGQRALQDRIRGRDRLARDDLGLDPATAQSEGLRNGREVGRKGTSIYMQRCSESSRIKP